MEEERKERQTQVQEKLIACGLGGLALILLPHANSYAEIATTLFDELGKALIVAFVIGWIIDYALKKDLVRDAVAASIGYLLPEQLRNEMHWVYGQKVIAEQSFNLSLKHDPKNRIVIVRASYDRVIRNITGEPQKVRLAGGTDEWFSSSGLSEITTAEYRRYNDQKYGRTEKLPIKRMEAGIYYGSEDLVDIQPSELIHLSVAYILICPDHGQETLTYRYPIENPVVRVDVPDSLRANIAISYREPAHTYRDWETGYLTARLNGTLLPHQDIHVVWHRYEDLKGSL